MSELAINARRIAAALEGGSGNVLDLADDDKAVVDVDSAIIIIA